MQENQNNQNQEIEVDENHLIQIRKDKLKELQEQGKNPFEITKYNRTNSAGEIKANYEKFEQKDVSVAGRIIAKRIMGKASFCTILDSDEKIQSYVSINDLGEESYKAFKTFDIGDIIGITGFVFKTRTEEISVHAKEVVLLSKSLRPLPEKFHGLKDVDLRYRQRYVDLIMNPEVKETFRKRSQIIAEIRRILDEKGYLEVETPILNTISGGATARPFITHHNTLDIDMYLRIATELNLKRLIVGGYDKVYEMGRIFRNEGMDIRHKPEFTSIELYSAYENYHDMMDITEEIFNKRIAENELKGKVFAHGAKYGEKKSIFWKNADVFVFPTYYHNECFPLVLLEAMQHGKACIASNEGGIPAIIEEGKTGYMVKKKDAKLLADKIEFLLKNPSLCQQMGKNGKKKFLKEFTIERFENNMKNILGKLITN